MDGISVTIFNQYYSKQLKQNLWIPHIVTASYFNADKAANIAKTGLEDADIAKLHIPYKYVESKVMIGELEYMDPIKWVKQPYESYTELITFADGKDFFYVGEYLEGDINDADYMSGGLFGFKDYMSRYFDHVYSINSVGKYSLIPHFEISGY